MRVAIFNDTRTKNKHFGCEIVMSNIEKLLHNSNLQPVWYWPVGQDWRKSWERLPKKGDVDAVIVNGEGTIHNSERRDRPDILADVAKMTCDYLEVPAFLINATLYQNSPRIYNKLRGFEKIYVRDSRSLKELEENGLQGEVVPDLTLSFPNRTLSVDRKGVGATDSVDNQVKLEIKRTCKQNRWTYCPMTLEVLNPPKMKEIVNPLKFAKITRRYIIESRLTLESQPESPQSFLSWLNSKEMIVTGRYHTVTLCLLTRTPFVAVESNTPKISSLLIDVFGSSRRIVSKVSALTKQDICKFSYFTPDELQALEVFLRNASSSSYQMMVNICTGITQEKVKD